MEGMEVGCRGGTTIATNLSVWRTWRYGVGVTLEVRNHRFVMGENGVEMREKILECVTGGVESKFDVGVGLTLEIKLHRFKKS